MMDVEGYGTREMLKTMNPEAQILVRADRLARLLDIETAATKLVAALKVQA